MKTLLICGVAMMSFGAPATAAADVVPAITPVLSGSYVYDWTETCYGGVTTTSFMSGVITFNMKTKAATLNVYHASGYPNITLVHMSGSGTYSNTSTTVTLPETGGAPQTYQATYGALLTGGIATNVSWIAAVLNGKCMDLAWLTRQ